MFYKVRRDSDDTRRRKLIFVAICLGVCLVMGAYMGFSTYHHGFFYESLEASYVFLSLLGAVLSMALAFAKHDVTPLCVHIFLVFEFAALILYDLNAIQELLDRHAFLGFTCLFIICVTYRMSSLVARVLCAATILWLALIRLHRIADIGLDSFARSRSGVPYRCDCVDPPCGHKVGTNIVTLVLEVGLMLMIYRTTSGFTSSLFQEQQALKDSITTAHIIAQHLSCFDLDAADSLLLECEQGNTHLPPALREAFIDILGNLRAYKPYLPRSCLPFDTFLVDAETTHEGGEMGTMRVTATESENPPSQQALPHSLSTSLDVGGHTDGATPVSFAETMSPVTGGAASGFIAHEEATHNRTHRNPLAQPPQAGGVVGGADAFPRRLRMHGMKMRHARVTLAVICLYEHASTGIGTLASVAAASSTGPPDVSSFVTRFEDCLSAAVRIVDSHSGVVDLFNGDSIFASFNTSKQCVRHAVSAVAAAKELVADNAGGKGIGIGIAGGKAMCGDMGCTEMRRFSVLGILPKLIVGLQRAAKALGVDVSCNTDTQQDANCAHQIRLHPRQIRFVEQGSGDGMLDAHLWEVVCPAATEASSPATPADAGAPRRRGGATDQEWMYELENSAAAQWHGYNRAVAMFLSGVPLRETLEASGINEVLTSRLERALHDTEREPSVYYV